MNSRSCLPLCQRDNISLSKSAEVLKPPPTGRLSFFVSCGPKQAAVMHTCDDGDHLLQSALNMSQTGLTGRRSTTGRRSNTSRTLFRQLLAHHNLVADIRKTFRARYSTIAPRRRDCLEQWSRIIETLSRKKRKLSLWQVRW